MLTFSVFLDAFTVVILVLYSFPISWEGRRIVAVDVSRQGFSLPTITEVSPMSGKVGSSWVQLSNNRDEFSSRVLRAWLGQSRKILMLQSHTPLQEFAL
jgi:hypothetical protein